MFCSFHCCFYSFADEQIRQVIPMCCPSEIEHHFKIRFVVTGDGPLATAKKFLLASDAVWDAHEESSCVAFAAHRSLISSHSYKWPHCSCTNWKKIVFVVHIVHRVCAFCTYRSPCAVQFSLSGTINHRTLYFTWQNQWNFLFSGVGQSRFDRQSLAGEISGCS